ncbi:MAG: tRNA lysidine(34) synthetase TilS [candidate division WOR-3 bacterium]|nr:MAG: tRNA lysidine(34) synthetase TilS [candidate division WOR-3 bacterium]
MNASVKDKLMKTVEETIQEHQMFDGVSRVIIAFSAGPDSVCLLDTLHSLYRGRIDFELVYVNHGMRPQSILRGEERMVKDYAERYGVKYRITTVKVKKKGLGVEAEARAARYNALLSRLEETGATRIALGHNLDDFVETFLMNLLRGSGMTGLKSIPAKRLPFVRPLLNCKKVDILKYLRLRRLKYATDRTNRSLDYRRNLLRMKVLPVLERLNPDIHETVRRECQIMTYDDEYLCQEANRLYDVAADTEEDCAILDINKLMRYNLSVTVRVVMKAIAELRGNLEGYESKHYYAIISLTNKEHIKKIDLPKGLYAQREYDKIVIGRARPTGFLRVPVDIHDRSTLIGDVLLKTRVDKACDLAESAGNREFFDIDELSLPLYVRNAKPGDMIKTGVGRKKLKKVYSEERIVPRKRGGTLLLCDQVGILWVIGVRRAARGFVGEETKRTLVVEYERVD